MIRHLLPVCVIAAALPAAAQTNSIRVNFETGVPSGFKLENRGPKGYKSIDFSSKFKPEDTWFCTTVPDHVEQADGVMALVSNSDRQEAGATDNWLITPQINVTANSGISWSAKSILPNLLETYSVMISTTGDNPDDFTPLTTVSEEGYFWTRHYLSLAEYAGQKVYIALVHNSDDCYLLALKDLYAGEISDVLLDTRMAGSHYFGETDNASFDVEISNYGSAVEFESFSLSSADGKFSATADGITLQPGHSHVLSIPVAMNVGDAANFTLTAKMADGSTRELITDFLNKSYFKRLMLIEKYTGTWCNACPKVVYPMHIYEHQMGADAISLEAHIAVNGNDQLQAPEYLNNLPVNMRGDYPELYFNRNNHQVSYNPTNRANFDAETLMPCEGYIKLLSCRVEDGELIARGIVRVANDLDNSGDSYRVGLTFTENKAINPEGSLLQQSQISGSGVRYGEYHFLGSVIRNEKMNFANVVRESGLGSIGYPELLPAELKAGQTYIFEQALGAPNCDDIDNLRIIATLIDGVDPKKIKVMNTDYTTPLFYEVEYSALTLSASQLSLSIGEKNTITATLDPADSDISISWISSDPAVATVENGEVTAISNGNATITAYSSEGAVARCEVSVVEKGVSAVLLDKTELKMNMGETATLAATLEPANDNVTLEWSSSNETVATVNNGTVTAVAPGTAAVTVTSSEGASAVCNVTVAEKAKSAIVLSAKNVELNAGETSTVTATLEPANEGVTLTWSSSNVKVATVDNGQISGVAPGNAIVTVTSSEGVSAMVNVTVWDAIPSAISLNMSELEIEIGEEVALVATLTPANPDVTVIWSSAKQDIASVSETGVVKGLDEGNTIIKARTSQEMEAICKVTVKKGTGINDVENGKFTVTHLGDEVTVALPGNGEYEVSVYSLDGKLLRSFTKCTHSVSFIHDGTPAIVRATGVDAAYTCKF